ncbi:activator of stress 1 [Fusarium longipes]|uniref:Activator of stress 1 n=1 Tax=Fusarium longipes TaxID=694270 RepID=A0A395RWU8_9HYPO|nr:activator of stress 1 [Fusarium longipes]
MRYSVFVSVAFALCTTAGPCKPSVSTTTGLSSSLEPSETFILSATSSAESSSLQPTRFPAEETASTSTDQATIPRTSSVTSDAATSTVESSSLQSMSLPAEGLISTSTDTYIVQTTSSVTSDAVTSSTIIITSSIVSEEATSSTSAPAFTSSPVLGLFNVIGQGGGASNTPARLPPPQYGSVTLGDYNPSGAEVGVFSIEAGTGALFINGFKICGHYGGGWSASVSYCSEAPKSDEAPIICDQGQTDGGALECSAPIMTCIEDFNDDNDLVCYATGGTWTQFNVYQYYSNYYLLSIGSQPMATGYFPISLTIQAL